MKQIPHIHMLLSLTEREQRIVDRYSGIDRAWCVMHGKPFIVCPCDPMEAYSKDHTVPYEVVYR